MNRWARVFQRISFSRSPRPLLRLTRQAEKKSEAADLRVTEQSLVIDKLWKAAAESTQTARAADAEADMKLQAVSASLEEGRRAHAEDRTRHAHAVTLCAPVLVA